MPPIKTGSSAVEWLTLSRQVGWFESIPGVPVPGKWPARCAGPADQPQHQEGGGSGARRSERVGVPPAILQMKKADPPHPPSTHGCCGERRPPRSVLEGRPCRPDYIPRQRLMPSWLGTLGQARERPAGAAGVALGSPVKDHAGWGANMVNFCFVSSATG